ncbi:DUF2125 domain-containing protein [Cognatishimia sp. WU-CL00825]|uniref:DUF2125 domain-containing protein n=1 Tax=Cognatishimia sp. WU-CL00825 TaxID=3127658 RepID=UPI003365A258
MTRWTQFAGTTALGCVFWASAASADVTAQDVWSDWRSYLTDYGYQVTATETTSGDTLTVADLKLAMEIPENEGRVMMQIPALTLTNQGNGTVLVQVPEIAHVLLDIETEDDEDFEASVSVDLSTAQYVASGEPNNMVFDYQATSADITLEKLVVDEEVMGNISFSLNLGDISGNTAMKKSDMRDISQEIRAETLSYDLRVVVPDEEGSLVVTGSSEDIVFDGTSLLPLVMDTENPANFFKGGANFAGKFSQGASKTEVTGSDDGKPFSAQIASASGEVEIGLTEGALRYDGGGKGLTVNIAGADIPFPLSFEMQEVGYKLMMPLLAKADAQDFGLGINLGGLAVPDVLWNLFDPANVLPRDPATLRFDVTGKTTLMTDLVDPEIEQADEFPGELNALTLSDLQVSVAGADLTGSGDFTFDNSDMESFDGLPRPLGAAAFRLMGGNGLLDKLIQMGFVAEQDAMGARMMMGLFATAGPAEDELNSRIEVNEQGHVLANGQRIK